MVVADAPEMLGSGCFVAGERTCLEYAGEWAICLFNIFTTLDGVGVSNSSRSALIVGEVEWNTMGNSVRRGEEQQ